MAAMAASDAALTAAWARLALVPGLAFERADLLRDVRAARGPRVSTDMMETP